MALVPDRAFSVQRAERQEFTAALKESCDQDHGGLLERLQRCRLGWLEGC